MMKKYNYVKPTCFVMCFGSDLMEETLPLGGSQDKSDSGDSTGGGLSKKGYFDMGDEEGKTEYYNVWDNE